MTKHTYPKQLKTEQLMVDCGYYINHPTLAQLEGLIINEHNLHCVIIPNKSKFYEGYLKGFDDSKSQLMIHYNYEVLLENLIIEALFSIKNKQNNK
jgi:hypothetical protein